MNKKRPTTPTKIRETAILPISNELKVCCVVNHWGRFNWKRYEVRILNYIIWIDLLIGDVFIVPSTRKISVRSKTRNDNKFLGIINRYKQVITSFVFIQLPKVFVSYLLTSNLPIRISNIWNSLTPSVPNTQNECICLSL